MRTTVVVTRATAQPSRPRAAPRGGASTPSAASAVAAVNARARSVLASATAEAAAPSAAAAPARGRPSEAQSTSDKYAVVEIGGVQLLVEEGRRYTTDRLAAAAGSKIALGRVLAVKAGGAFRVGTPYVEGAVVEAEVVDDEAKGPKLTVFKFKNKSHYKRKTGFRASNSVIKVTKIA